MASCPRFQSRFSNVWRQKIVHRTRAMPLSQAQTKVRKISGVIESSWNVKSSSGRSHLRATSPASGTAAITTPTNGLRKCGTKM
ncbi:alpha-L-rhamnosidase C-terminal domain-containing protein [Bifidobacterium longum]|uniref:alpha-L-rhamnosidase C-terminal domain-containing protein n=1 Tax=Bifidobacterium longum TaxID=216816 RepID=UPI003BAAEE29